MALRILKSIHKQKLKLTNYSQNRTKAQEPKYTYFGFKIVDEIEKPKEVHKVFETVATSYDLANDAMSLGIHRIWKDIFIHRLSPTKGTHLLDMAGGTGDIAFRFLNYVNTNHHSDCHVTISDINQSMLEVGKSRCKSLGYDPKLISWKLADAENLPFNDESFDAYTIAFGIRNCTHINKVIEEAYRVLKPGGRFLCLEFSHLENHMLQWLYDQYSFQVVPVIGQLVVGNWQAYQYLVESIRQFPNQEDFKASIEHAGFRQVSYENITFGIVAIHSGFKL